MALSVGKVFGLLELTDQWTAKIQAAAAQLGDFTGRADKLGRNIADVGDKMTMGITLPMAAIGGGAIAAAVSFESAFAGVRKTVDATESQFAELRQGIRDMSKEMPLSANDIAKVAEAAGQLGVKRADVLSFTETMVKLGATTNLTADEAATGMARFSNIMQEPTANVGKLGAALVALGNDGASTEREILDMSLRIAGAGKTVGLSSAEVLGMANALSSLGIEAEMGGSAISKMMINIAANVSSGGAKLEKFAQIAFGDIPNATDKFSKLFKEDAGAAIGAFVAGLGRVSKSGGDLLGVLADMDITETRLRDTMLRVANAGDVVTSSLDLGRRSFEESTALNKEYEERLKTVESQLIMFKNQLFDVGVTLGERLIPAMMGVVDALKPLLDGVVTAIELFSKLPQPIQTGTIAILALVATAGPVLSWAGRMIQMFSAIATAIGFGGAAAGAGGAAGAAGAAGAGAAGAAAGFGAILAGLAVPAALGGILYGLIQIQRALFDAEKAWRESRLFEHLTARRETALSRFFGTYVEEKAPADAKKGKDVMLRVPKPVPGENAAGEGGPLAGAAAGATRFGEAARVADEKIRGLSKTVRDDLAAALRSGQMSMSEMTEGYGLSEFAIKRFGDQIEASDRVLEKSSKASRKYWEDNAKAYAKLQETMNAEKYRTQDLITERATRSLAIQMRQLEETQDQWLDYMKFITNPVPLDKNTLAGYFTEIPLPDLSKLNFGQKFLDAAFGGSSGFGAGLASTIMSAIQGGGNVFNAAGGFIGQGLTTGLAAKLTGGLAPMIGGALGSAVNAVLPGLGALLGPITEKVFAAFGSLFDRNKGRDMVEEFADSFGGFDALHDKLLMLGDAGEQLWIKLTQKVGRNNKDQARAAIEEVTLALAKLEEQQHSVGDAAEAVRDQQTGAAKTVEEELAELERRYGIVFDAVEYHAEDAAAAMAANLGTAADEAIMAAEKMRLKIEHELDLLEARKQGTIKIPYRFEQEGDDPRKTPTPAKTRGGEETSSNNQKMATVNVNLDGRRIGRAVVPYVADELELHGV